MCEVYAFCRVNITSQHVVVVAFSEFLPCVKLKVLIRYKIEKAAINDDCLFVMH